MSTQALLTQLRAAIQAAPDQDRCDQLQVQLQDLADDGVETAKALLAELNARREGLPQSVAVASIDVFEPNDHLIMEAPAEVVHQKPTEQAPSTLEAKRALRQRLIAEVEAYVDADALLLDASEFHRRTAAPDCISLREDVKAAFVAQYKKLSGRKILKSELEGLFPAPKAKKGKTLEQLPLTEFGVTERMRQLHGHELAYAGDSGRWYIYRDGYWQEQPTGGVQVVQMARTIIKTLRPQAEALVDPELQEEALRAVAACERTSFAAGVVNGLAGEDGVLSGSLEFDTQPEFLTARNGLIDLRTGQLLPHDASVRATMVTGCDYVPGATRPWFEQTLSEAFNGCQETVAFLKRFMGYSIMGVPKERFLLMPLGKGKDGKSTIFNAIKDALGSHAATMNSSAIAAPMGAQAHADAGAPAEHLLRLRGKRLIVGSEIKRSSVFNDDAVKTLASGGDTILARGLWSANSVEFKPSGVLVNPANVVPLIRDDDPAVIDRLLLLRFAGQLRKDEAKVDTERPAKLAREIEGILAWLVEGALEYQEKGLAIPEAVKRVKTEILEGASPIGRFLEDCCELGPECAATTKELFEAWKQHSFEQGEKNLAQSEISFGRYISANTGIEGDRATVDGKQQRVWIGIRLTSSRTKLPADFFQRRLKGI